MTETTSIDTCSVVVGWEQQACVLRVAGELDLASAPLLRDALVAVRAQCHEIIVDLAGVSFSDPRGLGPIIDAHRWAQSNGRTFGVRNCSDAVERVASLLPKLGLPFRDAG